MEKPEKDGIIAIIYGNWVKIYLIYRRVGRMGRLVELL